jgi:hypothetical protein
VIFGACWTHPKVARQTIAATHRQYHLHIQAFPCRALATAP